MRASLLAVGIVLVAPATPALAHTELETSSPAGRSILTTAPAQVRLTFSDRLSGPVTVVVTDGAGRKIAMAVPVVNGPTATVRFAAPPANGTHTVAYRVVSHDGHTVQGSYAFRVAVPGATATTAPDATDTAVFQDAPDGYEGASDASATAEGGVPAAIFVAVPVLLLIVGGVLLARRRTG
jgi:copper resistance protein C